jgi:hypothetical protein
MFSSVVTGLAKVTELAPKAGVMVLPVDAAMIGGAVLIQLISFWLDQGEEAASVAVLPEYLGRLGHPPIMGPSIVQKVLASSGHGGLKGALAALAGSAGEASEVEAGYRPFDGPRAGSALRFFSAFDGRILTDIDTQEDLADALAAASPKPRPLTVREALTLLRLTGPSRKMAHALTVAALALRMAAALNVPEPELVFIGGLLHDLDHSSRRHDLVVAQRLAALGFDDLAAIVGAHTELPEPWARLTGHLGPVGDRHTDDHELYLNRHPSIIEAAFLVYLADKYAKGDRPVTLEERFGAFIEHGGSQEALDSVRRRWEVAKSLESYLADRLGDSPRDVALTPGDHPLERLTERLLGKAAAGLTQ